jgi:hypothetical protein
MKLNLNPPGIERLRLKCDDPLSKFGFNFNLHRYNQDYPPHRMELIVVDDASTAGPLPLLP